MKEGVLGGAGACAGAGAGAGGTRSAGGVGPRRPRGQHSERPKTRSSVPGARHGSGKEEEADGDTFSGAVISSIE